MSAPTAELLARRLAEIAFIDNAFVARDMGEDEADDRIRRMLHGRVTVQNAADAYASKVSLAENTRRDVRNMLRGPAAELAQADLISCDVKRVSEWIDYLRTRQLSVRSILCYWRRLRAIAMYAVEREWIGRLPWGPWRPKLAGGETKERECCRNLEELARLLAAARSLDARENFARDLEAKITTAIALGLRQGELAGLRWSDVDAGEGVVVVEHQYDGRKTKTRHGPKRLQVDEELFVVLGAHRARLEQRRLYAEDGPVFPSRKESVPGRPRAYRSGECLTTRSLRTVVRVADLPNIEAWSPHSLRDTFATLESIGHGGDLASVAPRTRHKSLSALARYLRAVRRQSAAPGFRLPKSGDDDVALLPEVAPALAAAPLLGPYRDGDRTK